MKQRSTLEQELAALSVQDERLCDELGASRDERKCVTCGVACGGPW